MKHCRTLHLERIFGGLMGRRSLSHVQPGGNGGKMKVNMSVNGLSML